MNYVVGKSASQTFRKLIKDDTLGYSPCVGVATCLNLEVVIDGHIFCFLPLPKEGSRHTGLPVHVNGFFALNQNRHHLKWATDQQKGKKNDDKAVQWNEKMVTEALPKAYQQLFITLVDTIQNSQNIDETVRLVYNLIPDSGQIVDEKWKTFVSRLMERLRGQTILYNHHSSSWVSIEEALFITCADPSPISSQGRDNITSHIITCLNEVGRNTIIIDPTKLSTLKKHFKGITEVTPAVLSTILRKESAYTRLTDDTKHALLDYLIQDKDVKKIQDLELLQLMSGDWTKFKRHGTIIFMTKEDIGVFPGMENRFCSKELMNHKSFLTTAARKGNLQLRWLADDNIKELLAELITKNFGREGRMKETSTLKLTWLRDVWKLAVGLGIEKFADLRILPLQENGNWDCNYQIELIKLASENLLLKEHSTIGCLSNGICHALQLLGVYVVHSLPDWIPDESLHKFITMPSTEGIKRLLSHIAKSNNMNSSIQKFNTAVTDEIRSEFAYYLSDFGRFDSSTLHFLSQLTLFSAIKDRSASPMLQSVGKILLYIDESVVGQFPMDVTFPQIYLNVNSQEERLVQQFSSRKVSIFEVVLEKLKWVVDNPDTDESTKMLSFVIANFGLFENQDDLIAIVKTVPFIKVGNGKATPGNIFDPSDKMLQGLFLGEDVFPANLKKKGLAVLRALGMKSVEDVTTTDLFRVGRKLDDMVKTNQDSDIIQQKAKALFSFLHEHPRYLECNCDDGLSLLDALQQLHCIPYCLSSPVGVKFPAFLRWYHSPCLLCKPSEVTILDNWQLVGSTMPLVDTASNEVIEQFGWAKQVPVEKIIEQLNEISRHSIETEERNEVVILLKNIYNALYERESDLPAIKEKLKNHAHIWTGECFNSPNTVVVHPNKLDVDLRPYYFVLPADFQKMSNLFTSMGCIERQTQSLLTATLNLIENKYINNDGYGSDEVESDRRIINSILDKLASLKTNRAENTKTEGIKVMIESSEENKISFLPANQCVYDDDPNGEFAQGELDDFVYIHRSVSITTAKILGVSSIKQQCFIEAEEIGLQEWGQRERLTTRIKTLIREGYSDGLAVPKELIQNADDAGATTVKFLYDERENTKHRKRLFSHQMSECQGAALWVYNDSEFSQKDFENITKLSGATKSADCTTIGKFGLGFCSVYNITDIPSFLSGNYMVILDPHEHYLSDVRATKGLKVNLLHRKIVKLHEDQFQPFENVFGCNVLDSKFDGYHGTLFRMPLRTVRQANDSEISQKAYSNDEMLALLQLLIDNGEHLLLYTQNVEKIELYHLPKHSTSATESVLLFSLSKSYHSRKNIHGVSISEKRLLHQMTDWFTDKNDMTVAQKVQITQSVSRNGNLNLRFDTNNLEQNWTVLWSLDSGNFRKYEDGNLPLAAVAVLEEENSGFPKTITEGRIFCFMPLPILSSLPFHINGFFSVTSDRRNLFQTSLDNKDNTLALWNKYLLEYSLTNAFISYLLQCILPWQYTSEYYRIWPKSSTADVQIFQKSFYRKIVENNLPVFPGRNTMVGFQDLVYLNKMTVKDEGIRKIASEVLPSLGIRGDKKITFIPVEIITFLEQYNTEKHTMIAESKLSEDDFLLQCLESIDDPIWDDRIDDRNFLLLKMLKCENRKLQDLLRQSACIPSQPYKRLCKISSLVHPNLDIAEMFNESDEVFPIDWFQTDPILWRLEKLGMCVSTMPVKTLLERCATIETLKDNCKGCTLQRIKCIVKYIQTQSSTLDDKTKEALVDRLLLPVLEKPSSWDYSWRLDKVEFCVQDVCENVCAKHKDISMERLRLTHCKHLIREKLSNLFGSVMYFLDEQRLVGSKENFDERHCFRWLGIKKTVPAEMALQQLNVIAHNYIEDTPNATAIGLCNNIIDLLSSSENYDWSCVNPTLLNDLKSKPIIPIGQCLVQPEKVAFHVFKECKGYLYCTTPHNPSKRTVLKRLGVADHFSIDALLNLLCKQKEIWKESICSEVDTVLALLQNLENRMVTESKGFDNFDDQEKEMLVLPDTEGYLVPSYRLAWEDNKLLPYSSVRIVHSSIAPKTAQRFGVPSKKVKTVKDCSDIIAFGQQEPLVTRLNGLLYDYPCDETIIKELIQNADDAGATEVQFIKYFKKVSVTHSLGSDTELQPALCVFNNSYFREEDFNGIRNLGIGSKSDDPIKTGKYGLGFNAVYHLTDEPSFITKGPNLGEKGTLCIFDPLLKTISEYTSRQNPGLKTDIAKHEVVFQDILRGYPPFQGSVGTIFRFPLRKVESEISKTVFNENDVTELLGKLKQNMPECLQFLKHVNTLKIMSYEEDGLVEEYSVVSSISQSDKIRRDAFFDKVRDTVIDSPSQKGSLICTPYEIGYEMTITEQKMASNWHFVWRFGGKTQNSDLSNALDKGELGLLPMAAVSVNLHSGDLTTDKDNFWTQTGFGNEWGIRTRLGKAFCSLPLPETTYLPFNVNGHFALDRSRRGLIKQGLGKVWNEYIIKDVLTEAVFSSLKFLQKYWCEQIPSTHNKVSIETLLRVYHSYFPLADTTVEYWNYLTTVFYQTAFANKLQLFPTVYPNSFHAETQERLTAPRWTSLATEDTTFDSGIFGGIHVPNDEKEIKKNNICTIVKKLGLLIVETPARIQKEFILAGVNDIVDSSPELMLKFLHTGVLKSGIGVTATPLQNTTGVYDLLSYCLMSSTFTDNIEGLPLCLTNDLILREFKSKSGVYCATECKLLTGSSEKFLHKDLVLKMIGKRELFEKGYLRKLTVHDFCDLLPHTYSTDIFKTGESVTWEKERSLLGKETIREILHFVYFHSLDMTKKGVLDKKLLKKHIGLLYDWSFLPSMDRTQHCRQHLIPIKDAHYLHSRGKAGHTLENILGKLNLPKIDESVFTDDYRLLDALNKLTCSTENPTEMLKCLVHYRDRLQVAHLKKDEAKALLMYMSQNLEHIQKDDVQDVDTLLKSLPLFETCEGSLTSIEAYSEVVVIPDGMPTTGLNLWREIGTVFLKNNDIPLYQGIGLQRRSSTEIYSKVIMPRITRLDETYIMEHINYIKGNVLKHYTNTYLDSQEQVIVNTLKRLPFVRQGQTRVTVSSLFSKDHPVFKIMETEEHFVPAQFDTPQWLPFLCLLGLNTEPTCDMLVQYAKDIAREAKLGRYSAALREKSEVLCSSIYEESWNSDKLKQLKHIEFLVPHTVNEQSMSILTPHWGKRSFIPFSDSVTKKWEDVCWSSVNILKHSPTKSAFFQYLGISHEPSVDSVITHCQSICEVFNRCLEDSSKSIKVAEMTLIMEKIYKFLDDKLQSSKEPSSIQAKLKERLKLTKFILISNSSMMKMMNADKVYTSGSEEDEIPPYFLKVPSDYKRYFQLFETIGAIETPDETSYITVISAIKCQYGDKPVPKNALQCVAKAIGRLFEILSRKKELSTRLAECGPLYLPNKRFILTKSSDLTIADNRAYEEALADKCSLKLFLGLRELDIVITGDPNSVIKKLPENHRPRLLSEDTSKNVCISNIQIQDSAVAHRLETFVRSNAFQHAICRIIRERVQAKTNIQYNESIEQTVKMNLASVKIQQVTGLQTRLSYRGQVVSGTTEDKVAFIKDASLAGQRTHHEYTLYFQLDNHLQLQACVDRLLQDQEGLVKLIILCTNRGIGRTDIVLVNGLFNLITRPTSMSRYLDDRSIKPYKDGAPTNGSVFPSPGTYVEEIFHPFLVQEIIPFQEHEFEYAAMELDSNTDINEPDSSTYIYVNIIQELQNKSPNCVMTIRYLVDVGERSSYVEVPIIKLFKFLPQTTVAGQEVEVVNNRVPTGKPFDENCREILRDLKEAMSYTEDHKKAVVRRLMRQWHPDRNVHQQEYASRVFNFIKEALLKLERKQVTSITIDEQTGRSSPDMSQSSWSGLSSSVERTSKVTAQAFHDNIEEYRRCGSNGRYLHIKSEKKAVHSLKEASVWLKLAKDDFAFAKFSLKHLQQALKGCQWICYMCHQSCEKALKAAWLAKDANKFAKKKDEHRLSILVFNLCDGSVTEAVDEFEENLGESSDRPLHTRLQYPDAVCSEIPADVADEDKTEKAVAITRDVIKAVEELIETVE